MGGSRLSGRVLMIARRVGIKRAPSLLLWSFFSIYKVFDARVCGSRVRAEGAEYIEEQMRASANAERRERECLGAATR